MAELFVVRHGQASFDADDYDQLSELGYQQARWLGEHFRALSLSFDGIMTGTLSRQKQTAESICQGLGVDLVHKQSAGLNEYDFRVMHAEFCEQFPERVSGDMKSKKDYYAILEKTLSAWVDGSLQTQGESWLNFQQRIRKGFAQTLELAGNKKGKRILAVSSGGAISTFVGQVLGLQPSVVFQINLQAKNSGFSHFYYNEKNTRLSAFNGVPHLEKADRLSAITYS